MAGTARQHNQPVRLAYKSPLVAHSFSIHITPARRVHIHPFKVIICAMLPLMAYQHDG